MGGRQGWGRGGAAEVSTGSQRCEQCMSRNGEQEGERTTQGGAGIAGAHAGIGGGSGSDGGSGGACAAWAILRPSPSSRPVCQSAAASPASSVSASARGAVRRGLGRGMLCSLLAIRGGGWPAAVGQGACREGGSAERGRRQTGCWRSKRGCAAARAVWGSRRRAGHTNPGNNERGLGPRPGSPGDLSLAAPTAGLSTRFGSARLHPHGASAPAIPGPAVRPHAAWGGARGSEAPAAHPASRPPAVGGGGAGGSARGASPWARSWGRSPAFLGIV